MSEEKLFDTHEVTDIDESAPQTCKKCNLAIYEGHAYELGDDRWHIHCFKCSKCNLSLGCNSNFLVLGNGNLICSNCSYNCKQCGKKIDDLAILTGDQAYCSSCFKCRSCKLKIEDLRYARTSKGLFCMSCHEKLIAKKKKYDLKKKQMALSQQQQQQLPEEDESGASDTARQSTKLGYDALRNIQERSATSTPTYSNSSSVRDNLDNLSDIVSTHQNISSSSISTKEKVLPPPPPQKQPPLYPRGSFNSTKTDNSVPSSSASKFSTPLTDAVTVNFKNDEIDNDYSIEEVNDSDDELNKKLSRDQRTDYIAGLSHQSQSKGTSLDSLVNSNQTPIRNKNNGVMLDIVNSSEPATPKQEHNSQLQPAATFTPNLNANDNDNDRNLRPSSPTSISRTKFRGKDLLILSPNKLHEEESHTTPFRRAQSPLSPALSSELQQSDNKRTSLAAPSEDASYSRMGCPSPFAKANRQARVVEANDNFSDTNASFWDNDANKENDKAIDNDNIHSTPKKRILSSNVNVVSPPPKLPLPVVPFSPIKKDKILDTPRSILENTKVEEATPKGLGLAGIDYEEKRIDNEQTKSDIQTELEQTPQLPVARTPTQKSKATPTVTNLEGLSTDKEKETPENKSELSRKPSLLRTPKISLKHKRSISGGNGGITGKFGFFKSNAREEPNSASEITRQGSVGSNGGSAYVTPPLPRSSPANFATTFQSNAGFNREHSRSTSDTPFIENRITESDLKSIKVEVYQLEAQRLFLFDENKKLNIDGIKLNEHLKLLQDKVKMESIKHENLTNEIGALEKKKRDLLEVNQSLSEQNHRLEYNNSSSTTIQQLPSNDTLYTNSLGGSTLGNMLTKANTHHSNSSSSLVAGAPYEQMNQDDQNIETQKATRLKFWRRPKISPSLVSSQNNSNHQVPVILTPPQNHTPTQGQLLDSINWNSPNNSKISQTYSSYAIRPPNSKNHVNNNNNNNNSTSTTTNNNSTANTMNGTPTINEKVPADGNKKGLGSFMTKSISSNILDSFSSTNNHNILSIPNNDTGATIYETDSAPLFSSSIQKRAAYENENVPLIITKCIAEVEKRGLDMEGIYRISGGNSAIVAIENAFADLPPNPANDEKRMLSLEEAISTDINAVTSALKRYLRKLPEPLLPYLFYDDFIKISLTIPNNKVEKRLTDLKTKVINKIPPANRYALFLICKHLHLVNSYSNVNRMNFKNLSVVFAPTLVRDETGEKEMIDMGHRNDVTELLLNNFEKLFYD